MDKDIKEQITPFELMIAKSMGITPEEAHIAIKLGVSPQAIMAVRQTKWTDKRKQIIKEEDR